eukprot:GHVL01028043.1.p1 GENE.GHVL01028043.1~~GHVL01028043.1.p1  ORF type:complete len:736 (-),score=186.44 GHVL01028043.1:797-2794(-)
MKMVSLLLCYNITPIIVFDGDRLPAKKEEDKERRDKRNEAKSDAQSLIKDKKKSRDDPEVMNKCKAAVSISSDMVNRTIEALQSMSIRILVAPYEADAQLAYLCRMNVVDLVISEDSDLIAYGCPKIMFKMDKWGSGAFLDLSSAMPSVVLPLPTPPNRQVEKSDKEMKEVRNWDHGMLVALCVLSGCDYTVNSHISGMGVKKACKFVHRWKTAAQVIEKLTADVKWRKSLKKEEMKELIESNWQATAVFLQHRVYCPKNKKITYIAETFKDPITLPEELLIDKIVGPIDENQDSSICSQIAFGYVDPCSKNPRPRGLLTPRELTAISEVMRVHTNAVFTNTTSTINNNNKINTNINDNNNINNKIKSINNEAKTNINNNKIDENTKKNEENTKKNEENTKRNDENQEEKKDIFKMRRHSINIDKRKSIEKPVSEKMRLLLQIKSNVEIVPPKKDIIKHTINNPFMKNIKNENIKKECEIVDIDDIVIIEDSPIIKKRRQQGPEKSGHISGHISGPPSGHSAGFSSAHVSVHGINNLPKVDYSKYEVKKTELTHLNQYLNKKRSYLNREDSNSTSDTSVNPSSTSPPPQPPPITDIPLMSWNVDGIDDNGLDIRMRLTASEILEKAPAIVFLQELIDPYVMFLKRSLGRRYEVLECIFSYIFTYI